MTTARALTKNDFRRVDHSRPDAGLDNGRRSWQVTAVDGLACVFLSGEPSGSRSSQRSGSLYSRLSPDTYTRLFGESRLRRR